MALTITIDIDSESCDWPEEELGRILGDLAYTLSTGHYARETLTDSEGRTVGHCELAL